MSKGVAKVVRAFFVKNRKFEYDLKKLSHALQIENRKLRYTIRDFLKRGELRLEDNELVYVEKERRDFLLDKVWRAWRYCPTWTISEIAAFTYANRQTVLSYVKLYVKAGYVERVGRKRVNDILCNVYRLKNRSLRERPQILNQREFKRVKQ